MSALAADAPSMATAWWRAARPATLLAAVVPVVVGTALAWAHDAAHLGYAAVALLGALFIQVGTNLVNDAEDFRRGADGQDRLGPPRATQQGWLSPQQIWWGAITCMALATALGMLLVGRGGWPILAVGLASIAAGILYTAGPWPLAYLGLGDVFVLIFFGVVATVGTYWVQALTLHPQVGWASIAVGLSATAILVVNNLRDQQADARSGKRTLVVRFGPHFGRAEHTATLLGPYLLVAALWGLGGVPGGWLLPLVALPLAMRETALVWRREGLALQPHLGSTARLGAMFGLLLAVGVLW